MVHPSRSVPPPSPSAQDWLQLAMRQLRFEATQARQAFQRAPYGEQIAQQVMQRFDRLEDLSEDPGILRLRLTQDLVELQEQVAPLADEIDQYARVCWRIHDLNRASQQRPELAVAMARRIVQSWSERTLEELSDLGRHSIDVKSAQREDLLTENKVSENEVNREYLPLVEIRRTQIEAKTEECTRALLCACARAKVPAEKLEELFERLRVCERYLRQETFQTHLEDLLCVCQSLAEDFPAISAEMEKYKKFQQRAWMLASLPGCNTFTLKAVACALRALAKAQELCARPWLHGNPARSTQSAYAEYLRVKKVLQQGGALLNDGKKERSPKSSSGRSSSSSPSPTVRQDLDEDAREMRDLARAAVQGEHLPELIGRRLFQRVRGIFENLMSLQIFPERDPKQPEPPSTPSKASKKGGNSSSPAVSRASTPAAAASSAAAIATPLPVALAAAPSVGPGVAHPGPIRPLPAAAPSGLDAMAPARGSIGLHSKSVKSLFSPPVPVDHAPHASSSAFGPGSATAASMGGRAAAASGRSGHSELVVGVDLPDEDEEIAALGRGTPLDSLLDGVCDTPRATPLTALEVLERPGSVMRELMGSDPSFPAFKMPSGPDGAHGGRVALPGPVRSVRSGATSTDVPDSPISPAFRRDSGVGSAFVADRLTTGAGTPLAATPSERPGSMVPLMAPTPVSAAATPVPVGADSAAASPSAVDAMGYPLPRSVLPDGWVEAAVASELEINAFESWRGDFVCLDDAGARYLEDAIRVTRRRLGGWVLEVAILDASLIRGRQGFEGVTERPAVVLEFHLDDELMIETLRVDRRLVRVKQERRFAWPNKECRAEQYLQQVELMEERLHQPVQELLEMLAVRRDGVPGLHGQKIIVELARFLVQAEGEDPTSLSDEELRERIARAVDRATALQRKETGLHGGFDNLIRNACLAMQLMELVRDPMQSAASSSERIQYPTGVPRDIFLARSDSKQVLEQAIQNRDIYSFNPREPSVSGARSGASTSSSWEEVRADLIEQVLEGLGVTSAASSRSSASSSSGSSGGRSPAAPSPAGSSSSSSPAAGSPAWKRLLASRQYKGCVENLNRASRSFGLLSWTTDALLDAIREKIVHDPDFGRAPRSEPEAAGSKKRTPKGSPSTPRP